MRCRPRTRRSRSRSPPQGLQCLECKRDFTNQNNLRRHMDDLHRKRKRFRCPYSACNLTFSRKHDLDRHWRTTHRDISPSTAATAAVEVPRTPGRDLDQISLHAGSVERRVMTKSFSPSPERNIIQADQPAALPPQMQVTASHSPTPISRVPLRKVSVQTEGGRIGHQVVERTIQELLDGEGKVTTRVIKERFLTDYRV